MNLIQPLNSPKVYETQPASSLSAEALNGSGFHGKRDTQTTDRNENPVVNENPGHQHLARYLAMGMSQTDAAAAAGYSISQTNRLMRTPWFQERIAEYMSEGSSDVMTLLKGAALDATVTLIEITNNEKVSPAVRVSSAKEILERVLGKSTQFVEMKSTSSSNPVEEVEALSRELAARRDEVAPRQSQTSSSRRDEVASGPNALRDEVAPSAVGNHITTPSTNGA